MRLWHQSLIEKLPRQQLLGQHRECCALRGKGWGKNHSTVNYVFTYDPAHLLAYHRLIMKEMIKRGYSPSEEWFNLNYRGKTLNIDLFWYDLTKYNKLLNDNKIIFLEHNDDYLKECIDNLKNKGIEINLGE